MKPDRSLLWWGLIFTGTGTALILVMRWWIEDSRLYDPWSVSSMILDGAGVMLVACGLILLVVDAVLRLTARRRQRGSRPPRSLRQVGLLVTVISGGITLAASLVTWVVEEIDDTHPLGQVGWLAFPAGFVAAGGVIALLGDALRSATIPPRGRQAAGSSRPGPHAPDTLRPRGASRSFLRAYALYLLVAALGSAVYSAVMLGGWAAWSESMIAVPQDVVLLLCAVAFAWGVWRPPQSSGAAGPGAPTRTVPGSTPTPGARSPSLRQWALAFTGGGAGIALTMVLLGVILDRLFDTGVAIGLGIFYLFALPIAVAGLVMLLIEAVLRRTGRRG